MDENIEVSAAYESPPFAVSFDCKDARKIVVFEKDGIDGLLRAFLAFLDMYNVAYKIITE